MGEWRSVDLGATGVSDFVVAAIAAHCPQLRHAALSGGTLGWTEPPAKFLLRVSLTRLLISPKFEEIVQR